MKYFFSKAFKSTYSFHKRGSFIAPIIFCVFAAIVLLGFYYASKTKGDSGVAMSEEVEIDETKAKQFLNTANSLENEFNAIHEFKKENITEDDLAILEKALVHYEKYLEFAGKKSYDPKYDSMRKQLHTLKATKMREQSIKLEEQGEELKLKDEFDKAKSFYEKAHIIEKEINEKYPLATLRNIAREQNLLYKIKLMEAIPLSKKAFALEKEGLDAFNAKNWEVAHLKLNESLKIFILLWADYRSQINISSTKQIEIDRYLTTIDSAYINEKVLKLKIEAQNAEKESNWTLAIKKWTQANTEYEILKKNFSDSLFLSEKEENEIIIHLANASIYTQYVSINTEYEKICKKIQNKEYQKIAIELKELYNKIETLANQFPKNTLLSKGFRDDIAYLNLKSNYIKNIQEIIFNSLLPIPGQPENLKMMKTEVSQALYVFVMPINPSANKESLENPVESVDEADINIFLNRLSIITGFKARLPKKEEYLAALGEINKTIIDNEAWSLANSNGQVQKTSTKSANKNGFYDLLGNVSEWTYRDPQKQKKTTLIFGGDYLTPPSIIQKNLFIETELINKSRTKGFRCVFEINTINTSK